MSRKVSLSAMPAARRRLSACPGLGSGKGQLRRLAARLSSNALIVRVGEQPRVASYPLPRLFQHEAQDVLDLRSPSTFDVRNIKVE